jgi:hypothetical protein
MLKPLPPRNQCTGCLVPTPTLVTRRRSQNGINYLMERYFVLDIHCISTSTIHYKLFTGNLTVDNITNKDTLLL